MPVRQCGAVQSKWRRRIAKAKNAVRRLRYRKTGIQKVKRGAGDKKKTRRERHLK